MAVNYRTHTRGGDALPNEGNIVIYYPRDRQWYDNVCPTQVLEFTTLSHVNGTCVVKYNNTIHEHCFYRNYGNSPIDCIWGEEAEELLAEPSFTDFGTRREEADESVTWFVIEEE